MFVMHFYLVCNMNKFVRVSVVYIFILATIGADEINHYKFRTTSTTTKWKEPTSTTGWRQPTTTTSKPPTSTISSKQPSSTPSWKLRTKLNWIETSSTPTWNRPTTASWKTSTTTIKPQTSTSNWKDTSTTGWKKPTTATWKQPTTTPSWLQTTSTKQQPTPTKDWKPPPTTNWRYSTTTKAPAVRIFSHATGKHGAVAIASFSGVDSRNGRVSSMDGIKIYPPVDSSMVKTDDKGNFIFKSVDGKMPMPITITRQGDGVSGTIRILPGSVSVSSSASSNGKAGPASAVASFNPWPAPYMKPIMNDIYFPPFPTFPSIPDPVINTRISDNYYHPRITDFPHMKISDPFANMKISDPFNMKFEDPFSHMRIPEPTIQTRMQDPWFEKDIFKQTQPKYDMFKPQWYYPSFSPFFNFWR
ncbi:uncharacterized protein LOC142984157 [Anticarsia gemmatalis]|uniref:uncharacterized protein LOC142984157 n=1 Tax=Anticarsia gemmatalis TaxID=129554 RepID=UPI003F761225